MTEKEQRRVNRTNKQLNKLTNEGCTYQEKYVSLLTANILAPIVCSPMVITTLLLYLNLGNTFNEYGTKPLLFIGTFVLIFMCFIVHELIHYLFMGLFAGTWKNIELGISQMSPYCTCQHPLKRWQYIISLIAPSFTLWLAGTVVAINFHLPEAAIFAVLHGIGGGGDILMIIMLLCYKKKNKDAYFIDHPTKCGFYAIEQPERRESINN